VSDMDVLHPRCPSCGVKLEGEPRGTRYKGNLTVIRMAVTDAETGEEVEVEHVCGD